MNLHPLNLVSSKPKGPGEEGAPRNHPEISSQKVANVECRFTYDSYGRDRAPFWALFRRRILGQYLAAPCSPGTFVSLLKISKAIRTLILPHQNFGGLGIGTRISLP